MNGLPALADLRDVPLTTVVAVAVGVLVLLARVLRLGQFSAGPVSTALGPWRPGWIARRRARRGIAHRRDRVGIGYTSALRGVHLTLAELAGHCLAVGGPKSGKTTFLRLLVEACVGRLPIVVIDPKGSAELADTVRAHGGRVWTIDGKRPADLLDPRPWQVPELLLEAEDYAPRRRRIATRRTSAHCGRPGRLHWTDGRWIWPSPAGGWTGRC